MAATRVRVILEYRNGDSNYLEKINGEFFELKDKDAHGKAFQSAIKNKLERAKASERNKNP